MASSGCTCTDKRIGNFGRPKCVHEMPAIAFFAVWMRFDDQGNRNTIDVSSPTLGADILGMIQTDSPSFRIHPLPRAENVTSERTETSYQTFPSGTKKKIPGVGGIRTFAMELVGKDGVNAILREAETMGCDDYDFAFIDVLGGLWVHKLDPNSSEATGFMMDSETWDAFKNYATDTTVNSIMLSFDMDRYERESEGYVLTPEDLGYKATTLRGLVAGFQDSEAATTTTAIVTAYDAFGTASDTNFVEGLLTANFTGFNVTDNSVVAFTATESSPGSYTLTFTAQTALDVIRVTINAPGYDFETSTFTAL